jgi:hypothetical protein
MQMKRSIRTWVIVPLLAASLAVARAESFYGSDWLFSFNGTLIVTGLLSTTAPINVSNQSITINQTELPLLRSHSASHPTSASRFPSLIRLVARVLCKVRCQPVVSSSRQEPFQALTST